MKDNNISQKSKKKKKSENAQKRNADVVYAGFLMQHSDNTESECFVLDKEWNGKEIRLQVHHKDGDHLNNELENLQLLCPNCHSQTDTYAGKKNKKGETTRKYERPRKHTCEKCGKPLRRKPKTGMCADCSREAQRAHREKSL